MTEALPIILRALFWVSIITATTWAGWIAYRRWDNKRVRLVLWDPRTDEVSIQRRRPKDGQVELDEERSVGLHPAFRGNEPRGAVWIVDTHRGEVVKPVPEEEWPEGVDEKEAAMRRTDGRYRYNLARHVAFSKLRSSVDVDWGRVQVLLYITAGAATIGALLTVYGTFIG